MIRKLSGWLWLVCGLCFALQAKSQTAKWIIKPYYDSVVRYAEGVYKVSSGNKVGVVNAEGEVVVSVSADSITAMSEGCALVLNRTEDGDYQLTNILYRDGSVTSIMGEYYVKAYPFFSEGRLPVYNKRKRYGYMDTSGKLVVNCSYSSAYPFSEGWAAVGKGKGILGIGVDLIKTGKEKISYIDKDGKTMPLQADLEDITMGTSFKNGEALVVTKEGKYCFINTSGKVIRTDNNVALSFDKKHALGSEDDFDVFDAMPDITYDGPSTFVKEGLYGYKSGAAIILPCQFDEAMPFSKGYAIASKNKKFGVLKLIRSAFSCRASKGTLAASGSDMESVDYIVTVPDEWRKTSLELSCIGKETQKCVRPGDSSSSRVFSFMRAKGSYTLQLEGEDLIVWNDAMGNASSTVSASGGQVDISISPSVAKANVKDNASVKVTFTNNTSEVKTFSVNISGSRLAPVSKELKLSPGQSQTIYATFTKVLKKEYRAITVSTSLTSKKTSKRIQLLPFFTEY
ncbi:KWG Leptospira repeat protein [Phocaeicola salanitronis DSM 18170]|uniref:KWG Leptospira repeat protein n=1 Tax=Phocaeicola salanitronis (strain DSM 18170 / JCM 13657 / CCUG 60908 / BL78) TaxID=667015 RepID=F0R7Y0_PHOSB|nr:WG repeat-containing protein [Phocaeicola salanitronis]ADY35922.1 KWG Leptospira repeat protein [Phocaeicola salanitronis DSM 18170]